MRLTLIVTALAALAGLTVLDITPFSPAHAQECTGENCPPKDGQGGTKSGCHSKENTVS